MSARGWRAGLDASEEDRGVVMTDEPTIDRERRVELARLAFKQFHARCFWSYRDDLGITEEWIPFVIRGLRQHGGMVGYRVASELCR